MVAELLLAAGVVLGCGGTPMDRQVPAIQRERGFARTIDTLGLESVVPAAAGRVWEQLPAVYADLGLEINFREPAEHRVGTCYQKLRARLGRELLSNYLECGETRGLPNADRYEVALTVLTTIVATSANTVRLHTFVLGVALDASGANRDRLWCYSKGVLEERIRTQVEDRARGT